MILRRRVLTKVSIPGKFVVSSFQLGEIVEGESPIRASSPAVATLWRGKHRLLRGTEVLVQAP
jgi:hypothetical protein